MQLSLIFVLAGAMLAQTATQAEKANRAKGMMAANQFAGAAELYGELVRELPGNTGLLLNQGMALHLSGQDAKAIGPLEAALKGNPNIPPALLFLGASYLKTGQAGKALGPLEKFVALEPANVEARQMIIDAASLSGQPGRAVVHLEKLGLWYELGRAYEGLALDTFAQLEKLFPESGPFFALLGDTRSKTSQKRAAFFFYRKALEKSPAMRGVRTEIAKIYRASDHPEWALHEEAAAAKLAAPDCRAKTTECEFAAGRYQSAVRLSKMTSSAMNLYWRTRAYRELSAEAFGKLKSGTPEYFRYKAETHRDQNQQAEAAEAWKEALRVAPGHPDFSRELAGAYLALKDYGAAQELATSLLKAEAEAVDLNQLQGDLYLAQQLPEKALPFLEKAVKLDGRYLPARASYARALLAAGKAKEALPHVTAALPLDSDGSLHIQLARACQAAGLEAQAKAAMSKYQEIQAKRKQQDLMLEDELQITAPK
ncbi:MAG: tetratricopeptide repeat protein [Acidobacteria bacterium]|nr:tetratricopeptide repeat protein [Acidobacteriota bacterium]